MLKEKNYLLDADFSQEARSSRSRHWTSIQHTGEKSFAVSIEDGILSVKKIGSQPWFLFRQRLDAEELNGQFVAFTADVRLVDRAGPPQEQHGQPGGLKLAALSVGKPQLQVDKRLAVGEPPEAWQRLQLVARVPPYTEKLELSFVHESDGVLQVRDPVLQMADPDSQGCAATPAG